MTLFRTYYRPKFVSGMRVAWEPIKRLRGLGWLG